MNCPSQSIDSVGQAFQGAVQRLAESGERPAHARMHERARTAEFEQQHLVHAPLQPALGPLSQVTPCKESGLVIVRAKIGRFGMRHVDGDQRNVRFEVLRRDRRRNGLVGLELDDEIDALANEVLGIAQGDLGLVAVVDNDQLDVLAVGRTLEAAEHLAGKGGVLALGGIPDPVPSPAAHLRGEPVAGRIDLLDQAHVVERVQETEAQPLAQAGALDLFTLSRRASPAD